MVESWLFIGGYMLQTSANGMLLGQVLRKRSVYGLSAETQVAYLLSTLARCIWSMDTRLVETKVAYLELVASVLVSASLVWCSVAFRHTNVHHKKSKLSGPGVTAAIVAGAMVLAILVHPGVKFWSVQILVAFSIYLEAVALLPQLAVMRRMVEIEPLTSNSVALIVLSRIVRLGFWISLFLQGENFFGLLAADILHCALTADYLVNWVKKLRPSAQLLLTKV